MTDPKLESYLLKFHFLVYRAVMPAKHLLAEGNNRVRARRPWRTRTTTNRSETIRKGHKLISQIRKHGPVMLIQRYTTSTQIEMGQILIPVFFSPSRCSQFNRIRKQITIITKVQIKKICPAPTVAHSRQPFGVGMYVAKWFAMHAVSTINCMASIAHIRCDVTQFTHAGDDQRVTNLDEEVRSTIDFVFVVKLKCSRFLHQFRKNTRCNECRCSRAIFAGRFHRSTRST